jgi:hypothetical protein
VQVFILVNQCGCDRVEWLFSVSMWVPQLRIVDLELDLRCFLIVEIG